MTITKAQVDALDANLVRLYAALETDSSRIDSLTIPNQGFWASYTPEQALEHTIQSFQNIFQNWFLPNLETYKHYIQNSTNGTKINHVKQNLRTWEQITIRFLKLLRKTPNPPPWAHRFHLPDWKTLRRYQKILALEALCVEPLPLFDLKKLATGDDDPTQQFFDWAECLEVNPDNQQTFHKGLQALVQVLQEGSLPRLQEAFRIHKCAKPILTPSTQQLQWRDSLHPGQQIGTIKLGKTIACRSDPHDKYHIYEVAGRTDVVLKIPFNRSILAINQFIFANMYRILPVLDIEPTPIIELDPKGRYALMKRLDAKQTLTLSDTQFLEDRIALICFFLKLDYTPSAKLHTFRHDNGIVRSLIAFDEADKNLPRIEQELIFTAAPTNPQVYRYIISRTIRLDDPVYKYYVAVISLAAQGWQGNLRQFTIDQKMRDIYVFEHAQDLFTQVTQIREECHHKAIAAEVSVDPKTLRTIVSQAIIDEYTSTLSFGRILPGFSDRALTRIMNAAQQQSHAAR